jgi:hypothetical protein
MKTTTTIKQTLLALTIALSMVSCKKDKKEDPTPPPVEIKAMTFTELKALSTGASVKMPDAKKITGIVISDAGAKNIDSKTVVLQETTGQTGLIVTFDAAQTFAVGDQLEVIVSNQTLAQTNGEIVLQNVPAANAKKTGTGTISTKATTATDIVANKTAWDGTLVTLSEGSFSGGNGDGKYTGSLTYTDAAGAVKSNILSGATFAGTAYPAAVNTITGIVRVNGTDVSIDLRNSSDVAASTTITRTITEDFSTYNDGATTLLGKMLPSKYVTFRTPLPGDEANLPAGRNYLYFYKQDAIFLGYIKGGGTSLKGLKQVSITFFPSKFIGDIDGFTTQHVTAFDPANDTNGFDISLSTSTGAKTYKITSVSYKDAGVSHTFTYKLPSNEAEMEAALVSAGQTEENAKVIAPTLLSNENVIMSINSNSSVRGNPEFAYQPIVFQKMIFGFDK